MPREAIKQTTCENCDAGYDEENNEFEDNLTVIDTSHQTDANAVHFATRCTCGVIGVITVDNDGTHAQHAVSHDRASWNEDESDE